MSDFHFQKASEIDPNGSCIIRLLIIATIIVLITTLLVYGGQL